MKLRQAEKSSGECTQKVDATNGKAHRFPRAGASWRARCTRRKQCSIIIHSTSPER